MYHAFIRGITGVKKRIKSARLISKSVWSLSEGVIGNLVSGSRR